MQVQNIPLSPINPLHQHEQVDNDDDDDNENEENIDNTWKPPFEFTILFYPTDYAWFIPRSNAGL